MSFPNIQQLVRKPLDNALKVGYTININSEETEETKMDIDNLLSRHSDNYRFHGVSGETLATLVSQSEGQSITLWGTDHDEHIDNADNELETEYLQGAGYLYVTSYNDIDMSYNEFCKNGGLVLVLEKNVDAPFECGHPSDRRQFIIKVEQWTVVGGLRPVFDEDEEIVDQEALSLEEIEEEYA